MLSKNHVFLFLFLLSLTSISSFEVPDVHFVIDGKLNGTAGFAFLDSVPNNYDYLLFSYDFSYHEQLVPKDKDRAFFRINCETKITDPIQIGYSNQTFTEINTYKDVKKIKWEDANIIAKTGGDEFDYYLEVKKKYSHVTLIIKVPIGSERDGVMSVENVYQVPRLLEEKNDAQL